MRVLALRRAVPRRPATAAHAGTPPAALELRRRLDLIILGHLWALGPLALLWFFFPEWRGRAPVDPEVDRILAALAFVAVGYLAVRTWLNLTGRAPALNEVWPYVDVVLVSTALILVRRPDESLAILYFIPLASAAATLSPRHIVTLAAATAVSYVLVVILSDVPWTIALVFRLVLIGLMASLYGWVLHTVTGHERAAERAEFQRDLAREIHDGIQHQLITLGVRLDLAHGLVPEDPTRAALIVREEREAARRAADDLRYLVRRLRVAPPQHTDPATALRLQVAALAERLPYTLNVDLPPRLPRLLPAVEHALLRVIQECLTNIAKHAGATQADLGLTTAEDTLRLVITDNGAGFDPATSTGAGLDGLAERLRAVGGTLEIRSAPGAGTTIAVLIRLREFS